MFQRAGASRVSRCCRARWHFTLDDAMRDEFRCASRRESRQPQPLLDEGCEPARYRKLFSNAFPPFLASGLHSICRQDALIEDIALSQISLMRDGAAAASNPGFNAHDSFKRFDGKNSPMPDASPSCAPRIVSATGVRITNIYALLGYQYSCLDLLFAKSTK